MSALLEVRQSQQLSTVLSAAQQASLKLLQMTSVELMAETDLLVAQNPFLEAENAAPEAPEHSDEPSCDVPEGGLPEGAPLEGMYATWGTGAAYEGADPLEGLVAPESVRASLLSEALELDLSDRERSCIRCLVEELDENGLLTVSLDVVADQYRSVVDAPSVEWKRALGALQSLEPAGIAQPSLTEGLVEQVRRRLETDDVDEPAARLLVTLLREHLGDLARADRKTLLKCASNDAGLLEKALAVLRELNPRPVTFDVEATRYVLPDLVVRRVNNRWRAFVNPNARPNVRFSDLAHERRAVDSTELKPYLDEARRFLQALDARTNTLMRIAEFLVERQQAFFEEGPAALRPLRQKDVAEALDLSESTVSRTTSGKYLQGPSGTVELKALFSSAVGETSDALGGNEGLSSARILDEIRALVAAEDPARPVADQDIALQLAERGYVVSRRTIAKYREKAGIPSTRLRRSKTSE